MDAADAFVRVAAGDNKARDSGVNFIVEIGKEIGREFCATSVFRSLGGVVFSSASRCCLTSVRRLDCLPQRVCCSLSCLVILGA